MSFFDKFFSFHVLRKQTVKMPKEIMQMAIDRAGNEPWGFIIIGGKDQSLTVKVGCRDLSTLGS